VTSPAGNRVTPKARTIGQAVGAGSLTVSGGALGAFACEPTGIIEFRLL
jgi:hypothetical protein